MPGWLIVNPVWGTREPPVRMQLQKLQVQSVIYGNPEHTNWHQNFPTHVWLFLTQCGMLAGFIKTMQAKEMQSYEIISISFRVKMEKWGEIKIATFQRFTYQLYVWKVVKKSSVLYLRYSDTHTSLRSGRIVPPVRWDGPDRLPIEVRSHPSTMKLTSYFSLWGQWNLCISGQLLEKFLGGLMKLSSLEIMRNPSLKSKSRQHVSQHRISRQRLRKCLGSSGHSYGVMPISLQGIYCWGHSPVLTNQNYVLKWRHKYVNEG